MALVAPTPALATGGGSIASAPTAISGQQEFGSTATDPPAYEFSQDVCNSWWRVPAISGDNITVNYTAQPVAGNPGNFSLSEVSLWPVGTTDFNLQNAGRLTSSDPNNSGQGELQYSAARDGTLPLEFSAYDCQNNAGPYNFTPYITHELVLALHTQSSRSHHSTTFTVSVHNPDGAPISSSGLHATFQLREKGKWVNIKTNAPLQYTKAWSKAQRSKRQSVRVTVSGPSYRTASISTQVKAR